MRTIAFFSFKGGVGRTNLVLNAAYALAKPNKFVVVADWDVHAPGLSTMDKMARPHGPDSLYEEPPPFDVRDGVLSYLSGVLSIDKGRDELFIDPMSLAQPTRLGREAGGKISEGFRGDIWFIPAGPFDPACPAGKYYGLLEHVQKQGLALWTPEKLQELNLSDLTLPHVASYFCSRVEQLEHPGGEGENGGLLKGRKPDFLLLDARTGMTEIGDMILHSPKVDHIVLVSGLNEQNLAGLEITLRALQQRIPAGELRHRVSVVASPVPAGEEALKQERFGRLRDRVEGLARELPNSFGEKEFMPEIHSIPYHPHIALSEELMVRNYPGSDPARAIQRIVEVISAGQEVPVLRPFMESLLVSDLLRQGVEGLDILDLKETARKGPVVDTDSIPHFSLHPWAQPPLWNWPEPSVTLAEFAPGWSLEAQPLFNALARSSSVKREQKAKILENPSLFAPQQEALLSAFQTESKRLASLSKGHWMAIVRYGVASFSDWLSIWCARRSLKRTAILEAVVSGARDNELGSWAKLAPFWFSLTGLLEDNQEWNLAERAYKRAIDLDEKWAVLWRDLGILLAANLGRPEKAEAAFRRAIELDEKDTISWHGLGSLLADQSKRAAEAEAAYRRAIELDEKFAHPWNGLGNILHRLNRNAEAESAYRRAIELDEKDTISWHGLGNLLTDHLNRYEEAETAYRRAIELDEKFAHPWNGLGNLLQNHLNRYEEAEAAYRRAIELDEKLAHPWNGLGNLLAAHLNRYEEAEAAYRRAIELDEKLAYPWNGLGNLLTQHLKRYEEAESAYRRAIELDGEFAHPWNGLGNLLTAHLNRPEEAESAYRRAIELDEKLADPWNGLGNVLAAHLKRPEEAEAAFRRAIELDENFALAWHGLGNVLMAHLKRPEEAESAYRRAIELDGKLADPWHGLGNLLRRQGRLEEAEAAYLKGMELDPAEVVFPLSVAELALVTGDPDKAASWLERAASLCKEEKRQQDHAMLQLALSLAKADRDGVAQAVKELSRWEEGQRPQSTWNYDDLAPAIDRLTPEARALFLAWVGVVKNEPNGDVRKAYQEYLSSL
ncbi:MAG: tetratricopeptide repeat protein [Magnetococcales bacterium]|nr:tetratricopeptide repeat protein [Magnetococcales bacterium]